MRVSTAMLRPGVAIGPYPERSDVRDGLLDRFAGGVVGMVRQHLYGRHPRYGKLVQEVNTEAEALTALDGEPLTFLIKDLRRRLYSEGFKDELVVRAFAIIREISVRTLGLRHHDVQLYGGWVMLQGMIAEMETGEGKTLTATLPAATAALAGVPVHIVTVNDFLVTRDAEWMGTVYRALGLTVGTITEEMTPDERRIAYAKDIVYCTNKQLTFDYLKDRLLIGQENRRLHLQLEGLHSDQPRTSQLMMRGLCFAIIDEADSVLIDEARTPLIISNRGDMEQQEHLYKEAINVARMLKTPRDYTIRKRDRYVDLTDLGKAYCVKLTKKYGGIWSGAKRRQELVRQALSALQIYQLDKHYIVVEGKIQIVDEYTGRVMADRSWEKGLHQMIEAKEGCKITGRQETLARISYQKFFRRYLRVSGMTGTAREVARELWSVYRLNVVTVPTNSPVRRRAFPSKVFLHQDRKWQEIVSAIIELHEQHRPILVGTRSVAASEHLSELLRDRGLRHEVLNARQDQEEARIIAQAGQHGWITVATNMAGRGTDIKLAPGIAELGGLHVIATERHEAARIDRQLFGRGGRQGDQGSFQAIVALEDDLVREFYGDYLYSLMERWFDKDRALPHWLGAIIVGVAQKAADHHHSQLRRDLLDIDDHMSDMLAYSGRGE